MTGLKRIRGLCGVGEAALCPVKFAAIENWYIISIRRDPNTSASR